jgi:hypothetical protein
MKNLLFTIGFMIIANLSMAQTEIGYEYNYEIKFDVSQFTEKEPKNTVRNFVDHLFQAQDEKFNVQTRYNVNGVIHISSNNKIEECYVEDYFYSEGSSVISFTQVPQKRKNLERDNAFAQN